MIHFLLGCFAGAVVMIGMVAIFGSAKEADAWTDGYAAGRRAHDEERQRA